MTVELLGDGPGAMALGGGDADPLLYSDSRSSLTANRLRTGIYLLMRATGASPSAAAVFTGGAFELSGGDAAGTGGGDSGTGGDAGDGGGAAGVGAGW